VAVTETSDHRIKNGCASRKGAHTSGATEREWKKSEGQTNKKKKNKRYQPREKKWSEQSGKKSLRVCSTNRNRHKSGGVFMDQARSLVTVLMRRPEVEGEPLSENPCWGVTVGDREQVGVRLFSSRISFQ